VTQRFPSSEYDVLVVVEGKTLLRSGPLEQLRNLVTDLQLVDGTRGAISLFSAREPPEGSHLPAPLFPDELPQGTEYDHLIGRMKANELIKGKLLSEDGQLALIVLSLAPEVTQNNSLDSVGHEIRKRRVNRLGCVCCGLYRPGVPLVYCRTGEYPARRLSDSHVWCLVGNNRCGFAICKCCGSIGRSAHPWREQARR
jgi:hypothetical protein